MSKNTPKPTPDWLADALSASSMERQRMVWPVHPSLMEEVLEFSSPQRSEINALVKRLNQRRALEVEQSSADARASAKSGGAKWFEVAAGTFAKGAFAGAVGEMGWRGLAAIGVPAVAVAGAAGAIAVSLHQPTDMQELEVGELVALEDHAQYSLGSSIVLSGNGAVALSAWEATGPRVEMEDGTMHAEVDPEGDRNGLVIRASGHQISVIGTQFDVTKDGDHIGVDVHSGVVLVQDAWNAWEVGAGDTWDSEDPPGEPGCGEEEQGVGGFPIDQGWLPTNPSIVPFVVPGPQNRGGAAGGGSASDSAGPIGGVESAGGQNNAVGGAFGAGGGSGADAGSGNANGGGAAGIGGGNGGGVAGGGNAGTQVGGVGGAGAGGAGAAGSGGSGAVAGNGAFPLDAGADPEKGQGSEGPEVCPVLPEEPANPTGGGSSAPSAMPAGLTAAAAPSSSSPSPAGSGAGAAPSPDNGSGEGPGAPTATPAPTAANPASGTIGTRAGAPGAPAAPAGAAPASAPAPGAGSGSAAPAQADAAPVEPSQNEEAAPEESPAEDASPLPEVTMEHCSEGTGGALLEMLASNVRQGVRPEDTAAVLRDFRAHCSNQQLAERADVILLEAAPSLEGPGPAIAAMDRWLAHHPESEKRAQVLEMQANVALNELNDCGVALPTLRALVQESDGRRAAVAQAQLGLCSEMEGFLPEALDNLQAVLDNPSLPRTLTDLVSKSLSGLVDNPDATTCTLPDPKEWDVTGT